MVILWLSDDSFYEFFTSTTYSTRSATLNIHAELLGKFVASV